MNFGSAFLGLWIFWLLYWIVSARGTKRTVYQPRSAIRFAVLVGFIILLVLSRHGPPWLRRDLYSPTTAVKTFGLVLCVAGLAISIWARRILGTNWSANPTLKEGHELIILGPYRYVRHPIYSGLLLALVGTVLAGAGLIDFILFAYVAIGLHFKSKIEESLMLRQFPDAYPAYQQKTKAIIPFVL
jgi:protein-S-isoprenylcysteine O-methyltransferase Ste14